MSAPAQTEVGAPAAFKAWAREYTEATLVRMRAQGRGGSGGTARWWATLPDDLRCFLLTQLDPENWERWMLCEWHSLPEALRLCIADNARAMRRVLEGCAWR